MEIAIIIALLLAAISIIFRIFAALRLTIPFAYLLVAQVVFHDWYNAHTVLAEGIFYTLLALAVFSWVWTVVIRIQQWRLRRKLLRERIQYAKETGNPAIKTDDLYN